MASTMMCFPDYSDEPTLRRPRTADDDEWTGTFLRADFVQDAPSAPPSEPPASRVSTPSALYFAQLPPRRRTSSLPPPLATVKAPRFTAMAPSQVCPRAWAQWRQSRHTPPPPRPTAAVVEEIDVELEDVPSLEASGVALGAPPRPVTSPPPRVAPAAATAAEQAPAPAPAIDTPQSMLRRFSQVWTSPTTNDPDLERIGPKRNMARIVVVYGCAVAMALVWLLIKITTPDATAAASPGAGAAAHALAIHHDLASSIDVSTVGLRDWLARRRADTDERRTPVRSSGQEALGTLIIESHAGPCALTIDGRPAGHRRRTVRSVPAGSHVVSCARNSNEQTRRAIVLSGEITYVGFANGRAKRGSAPRAGYVQF